MMKKVLIILVLGVGLISCNSYQRVVTQNPTTVYGEFESRPSLEYISTMSVEVKSKFHTQGDLLKMARSKYGEDVTIDNIRIDRRVTRFFGLIISNNDINITFDVIKK